MRISPILALALTLAPFLYAADQEITITPDVVYGHKYGMALTMDVYQPKDANGVGILFMVSGGWYSRWAPPERTEFLFKSLLDNGFTVFSVRHGSSPKFLVPEIVSDVRRSIRFVHLKARSFGVDPNRLGVSGGSAGGHLALVLATTGDDGDPDAEDPTARASSRVAAVVAYFPPTDLRPYVKKGHPYRKQFPALQFDLQDAEAVSPLLHASPDDPPALLIHGDKDELVPIWHSKKMVAAFKEQGVESKLIVVHGAGHGFQGQDAKKAAAAWTAWFKEHLL